MPLLSPAPSRAPGGKSRQTPLMDPSPSGGCNPALRKTAPPRRTLLRPLGEVDTAYGPLTVGTLQTRHYGKQPPTRRGSRLSGRRLRRALLPRRGTRPDPTPGGCNPAQEKTAHGRPWTRVAEPITGGGEGGSQGAVDQSSRAHHRGRRRRHPRCREAGTRPKRKQPGEAVDQSSRALLRGRRRRLPGVPWTRVVHTKEADRRGQGWGPGRAVDKSSVYEGGPHCCRADAPKNAIGAVLEPKLP